MTLTLPIHWNEMTPEERVIHCNQVGERVLEHRYRYYVKDDPVLKDFEYDYLEKYYEFICRELNLPIVASEMVDFDFSKPGAKEAADRVETDTDSYSTWLNQMKPIWREKGLPRKLRGKEDEFIY